MELWMDPMRYCSIINRIPFKSTGQEFNQRNIMVPDFSTRFRKNTDREAEQDI